LTEIDLIGAVYEAALKEYIVILTMEVSMCGGTVGASLVIRP